MTDAELERLRDKNGVAMPRVISGVAAAAASAVVIGVGGERGHKEARRYREYVCAG